MSLASFDSSPFASLCESVPSGETELPLVRDWIGLIPANPVRAAADGAMLPLVVFAAILGLAITRTETAHGETLVHFFDAIARAMFIIVEWILAVAPVGPDLQGVTERRSLDWFVAMVIDPDSMPREDPAARELFAEYMTPMMNIGVNAHEAASLYEYLRHES